MAVHATKSGNTARQRRWASTAPKKKHRFVPFTERVANLRIDPIRSRRYVTPSDKSEEITNSHFATALDHWKRTNLSETFRSFAAKVEPLCQNFAQLLHYDLQIYENISQSIQKHDALALEALLDLMVQFARDLGPRFEAHFQDAVLLVANLAGKHSDIDVIEWSFSCLTWLFKYLSRLLVSNLGPLYRAFAPLLGREHQKPFIIRFAAEAMSFLVRKTAVMYSQDPQPLQIVIRAVQQDLREYSTTESSENRLEQYKYGIMSLFINVLRGVDQKLHSGGLHLYTCLLETAEQQSDDQQFLDVFYRTTIALVHNTDAVGLQPISDFLTSKAVTNEPKNHPDCDILARTLYLLVAVRKGSRIESWQAHYDACIKTLWISKPENVGQLPDTYKLLCALLCFSPASFLHENFDSIAAIFKRNDYDERLIAFGLCFQKLNPKRFQESFASWFAADVVANWHGNIPILLESLPLLGRDDQSLRTRVAPACEAYIEALFTSNADIEANIGECFITLKALPHVTVPTSLMVGLMERLEIYIRNSLANKTQRHSLEFSLGLCLQSYVVYAEDTTEFLKGEWANICHQAETMVACQAFLEAVLSVLTRCDLGDIDSGSQHARSFAAVLSKNLQSPSSKLRMLSLSILQRIAFQQNGRDDALLSAMLDIEATPISFDTSRLLALKIRKLGQSFHQASEDTMCRLYIPEFFFGLLSLKLESAHTEVIETLGRLSEDPAVEKILLRVSSDWLQTSETDEASRAEENTVASASRIEIASQDFSCTNLDHIESVFAATSPSEEPAAARIEQSYLKAIKRDAQTPKNARSLALGILVKVPRLAEKNSQRFVPIFLAWATQGTANEDLDDVTPGDERQQPVSCTTADRKAMLKVIAQFQNLKQCFKAEAVYKALQDLLKNGDADIQRLSIEALLSFKSRELSPYRQNLLNLLDDAYIPDEMSYLLDHHADIDGHFTERPAELLPIVLRVLYGRMINREKGAGSNSNRDAKRKAIFQSLHRFDDACVGEFISITLGGLRVTKVLLGSGVNEDLLKTELLTMRKQLGVLRAVESLVDCMGSRLEFQSKRLLDAVFFCLIQSSRNVEKARKGGKGGKNIEKCGPLNSIIRQLCLKCLNHVARRFEPRALEPYITTLYAEVFSPRMSAFARENGQGVSGVLRLLSAWAQTSASLAFLIDYNADALDALASCLSFAHCKDEVKIFVLDDIVLTALKVCKEVVDSKPSVKQAEAMRTAQKFLEKSSLVLVHPLNMLVGETTNKTILLLSINIISLLARIGDIRDGANAITSMANCLLKQPASKVNPMAKGELVRILGQSLQSIETDLDMGTKDTLYITLSSLFGYFKDFESRHSLAQAFVAYAAIDPDAKQVAEMCHKLNAVSIKSIDTPDYDLRMQAFSAVVEISWTSIGAKQARPLVENLLFFLRDDQELAFRSNASLALRGLVEAHATNLKSGSAILEDLIHGVLLPSLKKGALNKSELVRQEHLNLLDCLLRNDRNCSGISDLQPLLVGDDEEAAFFKNILHIQQHRRVRALRRLGEHAHGPFFASTNVSQFLIPLVELFVVPKDGDAADHNLMAEAIKTIGSLARSLEWPQFRATFRRYATSLRSESDHGKIFVKLLGVLSENLSRAVEGARSPLSIDEIKDALEPQSGEYTSESCPLGQSVLKGHTLQGDIKVTLLPLLDGFVHQRDESTVSLRVPVAVTAVRCLQLLESSDLQQRLPPLLTDVCNILRSKSQDSRDLARKTLAEIAALVGPEHLKFLIQELRTALPRGYQLHVLSYTLHSILIHMADTLKPGDLDDCLDMIAAIIIEDTLGKIGQEKDAEEYVSKMKEVKNRKSNDSMELVSKTATATSITRLLRPLQDQLAQRLDFRAEKKIDELLRRIELGLCHNRKVQDQSILILCYEIIQDINKDRQSVSGLATVPDSNGSLPANKGLSSSSQAVHQTKIWTFAFNVLRTTISSQQHLRTPANLHGFIPLIGQALIESDDTIRIAALRLLSTIISLPLQALSDQSGIYIAECVKIVKNATSTSVELAQAAYKTAATIMRERPGVDVRESDIAYLLKRLVPDLEQPSKQGSAFNFLRAVLRRGIVIGEVYEVMDVVAMIMVTNQTKGIRDTARESYVQFLLDYPQSKDRYAKQINYLTRNLDYKHPEGRQSVMEALHKLFNKGNSAFFEQAMEQNFVPLVLLMINDDSVPCREMASVLIKKCSANASDMLQQSLKTLLRSWMGQEDNAVLRRASFQVFSLLLEVDGAAPFHDTTFLLTNIQSSLDTNLVDQAAADWELVFFALQVFSKLCQAHPSQTLNVATQDIWIDVFKCIAFPHQWIKLSAAKLIGLLFADIAKTNKDQELSSLPLESSGGIPLTADSVLELAGAFLRCLESSDTGRELTDQALRNTVFIGKVMLKSGLKDWNCSQKDEKPLSETDLAPDEEPAATVVDSHQRTAFVQLVWKCSKIMRRPPVTGESQALGPLRSSLKLMTALVALIDGDMLLDCLGLILLPLNSLTDPSTPAPFSTRVEFKEEYDNVVVSARDLMDKVQHKAGTQAYLKAMQSIQDRAKQRRMERKSKRAIERVTDPVKAGRDKRKKNDKKRAKRKERHSDYRSLRRGF